MTTVKRRRYSKWRHGPSQTSRSLAKGGGVLRVLLAALAHKLLRLAQIEKIGASKWKAFWCRRGNVVYSPLFMVVMD